jgi:hypothetical protein
MSRPNVRTLKDVKCAAIGAHYAPTVFTLDGDEQAAIDGHLVVQDTWYQALKSTKRAVFNRLESEGSLRARTGTLPNSSVRD